MSETIPMVVRVAGLPMAVLEAFSGSSCREAIETTLALREELRLARTDLLDKIYGEILGAPPALRRLLLTIKRDCFNGRVLAKHIQSPHWEEVRRALAPLPDQVLALERRLEAQIAAVQDIYEEESKDQRRVLVELLESSELLRGIALASPDLLHNIGRLDRNGLEARGRKEKRVESSLLRYVSRAAAKLSPFSTLTRVALGGVSLSGLNGDCELRLRGEGWSQRSLVRVRRLPLNRFCEILSFHPAFREGLEVVLNNTIETIGPDRYRLLRPGGWGLDDKTGEYQPVQESIVRVGLSGPVIAWLIERLPAEPRTYGELVSKLSEDFRQGSPDKIRGLVDSLVRAGFLKLLMPWPANTVSLEDELIRYLRSLPADTLLAEVRGQLEQMVRIRDSYPESRSPAGCVDQVDQSLENIWHLVKPLTGMPADAQCSWLHRHNLNEDVFLEPLCRERKIVEIDGTVAASIQCSLEPLERISNLFSHRYDFLHTLAGFARQRWPERTGIGFLELYGECQALWRQYTEFNGNLSASDGPASFNPLHLAEVEHLHACREQVTRAWAECIVEQGGEIALCADRLDSLARSLPELYRPIARTCFFLQPADRAGALWVLNGMLDGMGRFGSRYTPLLDEEAYREYARNYPGSREREGPEFVDLMCCAQGDNLNIHRPQIRVAEIPGEVSDVSPDRRLSLRELRVDWAGSLPRLLDGTGRHLSPLHLGPVSLRLMPALVRFLAMFGASDFGLVLPPRPFREEGDVKVLDRMRLGNVIVRRQRWTLALEALQEEVKALPDADFFLAVNSWRIARGLPDRVFVEEKIPVKFFKRDIFKPQYMDFTSPLFVRILRAMLQTGLTHLSVQEMLPDSECAPQAADGKRWAIEVQLDGSAMERIAMPIQPSPPSVFEGPIAGGHRFPERGDVNGREAQYQ